MPNTNLRTNIVNAATGAISDANIVHGEINRLSRDTGWCDVTDRLRNGWTAASVRIRRVDYTTILAISELDSTNASSNVFLDANGGEDTGSNISSYFLPDLSGAFRCPIIASPTTGFGLQIHGSVGSGRNVLQATFHEGVKTNASRFYVQIPTFRAWPSFPQAS